ncbi:MAG: hypothetical protein M5U29_16240, partial [Anaerolineae bacterium]|nr:hypothetical protein [Anaerolineae bacterium]
RGRSAARRWGVVCNNLRLIGSGLYDRREIWRVELSTAILVLLTGLSLGIWARVARAAFIAVLVTLGIILFVPILAARIPQPTIHALIEPRKAPLDFVFVGYQGDTVRFVLDPQTDLAALDEPMIGFVETQSRAEWSTQSRQARSGDLDLAAYNLVVSLRLVDGAGRTVTTPDGPAEIRIGAEESGGALEVTLPADGWYVLKVTRDDEANGERDNNQGYAWLRMEGVELFSSQEGRRPPAKRNSARRPRSSARCMPRKKPTASRARARSASSSISRSRPSSSASPCRWSWARRCSPTAG